MSVESLAQALLEGGILDATSMASRVPRARSSQRLLEALVADGIVTENALVTQLARALSVPRYDPRERQPEPEAVALLNKAVAEELGVLPVAVRGGGALLWVALCDPTDEALLAEVTRRTGRRVKACLIGPRELNQAMQQLAEPASTPASVPMPAAVLPVAAPPFRSNGGASPFQAPGASIQPMSTGAFSAVSNGLLAARATNSDVNAFQPLGGMAPPLPKGGVSVFSVEAPATPPPPAAPPGAGPAVGSAEIRRLEEEVAQVRQVVRILTQLLVERGALDNEELRTRLRAERDRKG